MLHQWLSSESVTSGHPDRLADYISESILDAFLSRDSFAHCHCQTVVFQGLVVLSGKITSDITIDFENTVAKAWQDLGYGSSAPQNIINNIIHVDDPAVEHFQRVQGRAKMYFRDQGIVCGFATNTSPDFLPIAHSYAKELAFRLSDVRARGVIPGLLPDGKSLVVLGHNPNQKIINHISLSSHVEVPIEKHRFADLLMEHVLKPFVMEREIDKLDSFYADCFLTGGPMVSVGISGKKIVVDHYGPSISVGGGSFSGKDASRFDRSGAYWARYMAKNIVAAELASHCLVKITARHGGDRPVIVELDCYGTETIPLEKIKDLIEKTFPLELNEVIHGLRLRTPLYKKACLLGHFGNSEMPWEQLDQVRNLQGF